MFQDKIKFNRLQIRTKIIKIAREWLNTPYQHQAMLKGVGVDCVGLIVGVGREAGILRITDEEINRYSGYGRLPNPKQMGKVMTRHLYCKKGKSYGIGDILWLEWRKNLPMHLAFISEYKGALSLIHAFSGAGKVVEHTLTPEWDRKIRSYWCFPELC